MLHIMAKQATWTYYIRTNNRLNINNWWSNSWCTKC